VKFVYVGGFVCTFKLSEARLKDRLVNKCGVSELIREDMKKEHPKL
jgi:hypothetical protein